MAATHHIDVLSSAIYLLLIFISVIIAVFSSMFIIEILTRKSINAKEEIVKNRNLGMALIFASFIWTIGRMCFETIRPIMNALYSTYASGFTWKSILFFSLGILGALTIAGLMGGLTVFLSVRVLMVLTRDINEWEEIKRGNSAVAAVIAITILIVGQFFESIVGYIVLNLFSFLL